MRKKFGESGISVTKNTSLVEAWGKSVVERLSKDLQTEFSGIRGFSARNIWNMKNFYEFYAKNEKLQPLVAEIGWVQNCIIVALWLLILNLKKQSVMFALIFRIIMI